MPRIPPHLIRETFRQWRDDDVPQIAAALTYYVMLSLAPLLILLVGVLGRYLNRAAVTQQLLGQAFAFGGPPGEELARDLIATTQPTAAGTTATVLALGIALWGSMRVFRQIRLAFDRMWDIPPDEPAGEGIWEQVKWNLSALGRSNLVAFLMVIAVGATIVASLALSSLMAVATRQVSALLQVEVSTLRAAESVLSLLLLTVLFALVYRYLPRTSIAWRDVWIGAGMTAILFVLGRALLGMYFAFASPGSAYGAAGAVVALLLWTNMSLQLVLFGAEFTHAWTYMYGSRAPVDKPIPTP